MQSLAVHNYRSLRNISFQPGALSVIIGANGAGKSNLVDAIAFVAEICRSGLGVASRNRGGPEAYWYRKARRSRGTLNLAVDVLFDEPRELVRIYGTRGDRTAPAPLRVSYDLTCRAVVGDPAPDLHVVSESLRLATGVEQILDLTRRDGLVADAPPPVGLGGGSFPGPSGPDGPVVPAGIAAIQDRLSILRSLRLEPGELLLGVAARVIPAVGRIAEAMGSTAVLHAQAPEGRRPSATSVSPRLDNHGGNLAALIWYFKEKDGATYRSVLSALQAVAPWLEDLIPEYTSDRRVALSFKERGVSQPWHSDEVSDGTIMTLTNLVGVADPRSRLVVIEEPENNVHPWITDRFYAFCREVARTKQIIITTHSPRLLNLSAAQDVFVVWRQGFATQILPATETSSEQWDDLQLGDYWASGGIPLALPPVFSQLGPDLGESQ